MAKTNKEKFNYKNVKINEEELSITKIGEMKTIEQNPIFIVILFGILLLFIFFLPTVVNFIKGPDEKPDYSVNNNKIEDGKKDEEDLEKSKDVYYELNDALIVNLEEKVTVQEFIINGNDFSFQITNSRENRFASNNDHYFLELYTEENTLLERFILDDIDIPKNSSETYYYTVLANTASKMKKIRFVKKEIMDYPNVTLEKNNNGEEILTCTKDTETITYKFQNEKLISITDIANYSSTVSNYGTLFNNWKADSEKLNNISGISSVFVDAGNGFVVNTTIDLKTAKLTTVENNNFYTYETLAKVVKFEMEARGFRCK